MANEIPVTTCSNDQRTIGIELEYANVRGLDLAKQLGEDWEVIGDSSIRNTDGSWSEFAKKNVYGAEIRTIGGRPPAWYTRKRLQGIFKNVRDLGGKPNRHCGLHIHIGTFPPTREVLLQAAAYFHRHPVANLAGTSPRRQKKQCAAIDRTLLEDFATIELDQLKGLSSAFATGEHNYHRQREVNVLSLLKFGTIEYRMFASTLDASQALAAIDWCLALTDACMRDLDLPLPTGILPPAIDER